MIIRARTQSRVECLLGGRGPEEKNNKMSNWIQTGLSPFLFLRAQLWVTRFTTDFSTIVVATQFRLPENEK